MAESTQPWHACWSTGHQRTIRRRPSIGEICHARSSMGGTDPSATAVADTSAIRGGEEKRKGGGGGGGGLHLLLVPPMSLRLSRGLISALDVDLRSRYKTTLDSVVSGTASYGEADDLGNWPKEDLDQHPRHLAQREMIAPEERKRGEKALGRVRSRGIRRPHAAASARLSM